MIMRNITCSHFGQDFAASPRAAICGAVVALLLKKSAARNAATAQEAAALLPLVGNSAPPHSGKSA